MLLQLGNAKKSDLKKLFDFAKENSLELTLVDADKNKSFLPGESLSAKEIKLLISKSRESGSISMEKAHQSIRKRLQ